MKTCKYKCSLEKLLKEDVKSYYWIGFLLADGCFTKKETRNTLSLEISNKDKKHLKKFRRFINSNHKLYTRKDYRNTSSIHISGPKILDIMHKFDIHNNKTKNPPNISRLSNGEKELVFSLLIGFIDGDGNIRETFPGCYCITIQNHRSWENFYVFFENFFFEYFKQKRNRSYIRLDIRKYITFSISRQDFTKQIKKEVKRLKLPCLNRKWNVIKENNNGKQNTINNIAFKRQKKAIDWFHLGKSRKEIAKIMHLSVGSIESYINENLKTTILTK